MLISLDWGPVFVSLGDFCPALLPSPSIIVIDSLDHQCFMSFSKLKKLQRNTLQWTFSSTSSPANKISGRLWRRIKNRRRQIRWYDLNNNESTTLLTFTIWNITMFKNEPFLSNRRFKKGCFLKKVSFYFFIKRFLHTFCQKRTFCYPTTFIESLITHKRFVFEESYILYGKRQKSCTFIVVYVKCLYLTSQIFNSSVKSNRTFYLPGRK